jgi:hypothetical protein
MSIRRKTPDVNTRDHYNMIFALNEDTSAVFCTILMVTAGYAELNYYGCLETRRDIGK